MATYANFEVGKKINPSELKGFTLYHVLTPDFKANGETYQEGLNVLGTKLKRHYYLKNGNGFVFKILDDDFFLLWKIWQNVQLRL